MSNWGWPQWVLGLIQAVIVLINLEYIINDERNTPAAAAIISAILLAFFFVINVILYAGGFW